MGGGKKEGKINYKVIAGSTHLPGYSYIRKSWV